MPAALLRRASAALAEAKRRRGAGPCPRGGRESATARNDRLEIDLRRALDQDEIEIRFQPQVSVTSGAIVGAEALARWNHPQYGELGALTLFGVAEGSDYLVQLSDHVQRKAIDSPPPPGRRRSAVCACRSTSPPPTSSGRASPPSSWRWSRRAASIPAGSPSRSPKAG